MTEPANPNDPGPDPATGADTGFRLLGPLEVVLDGETRQVPSGRQRAVLAALLLRPGEVVPGPTLMEQVWGGEADRTVLNVCVMRLRRSLHDRDHALIRAEGNGYRIAVDPEAVDLHRFRRLCARAAEARDDGDRERERKLLGEALSLWRGEAFAGVASPMPGSAIAAILEEERLAAIETRIDADLECGSHAEVTGELRQLVADHPFRERFWCQLLLALHRGGRRAEALDAYLEAHRRLTEELGVEPGEELRDLHRRILTGDPGLPVRRTEPTSGPQVVPAQLPPAIAGFSGRRDQIRRLDRSLDRTDPVPVLITGPPGVGKTALAVHWAGKHRERWPDGQLYIDLRGYGSESVVRPIETLAYFLRAIGVPADQVPRQPAAASTLFRSLIADRRMLLLLDNAATIEQVRPLLPGGHHCSVIVTSRDRLTGLAVNEGAQRLSLDVMAENEAETLLAYAIGDARPAAEPEAVTGLARLCGNLPLALRITAADLLAHPQRGLAEHLDRLRGGNRLDAFQVPDDEQTAVRAVFRSSYNRLPEPVRRLFRLLGLFPGTEFGPDTAAALAGLDPGETVRLTGRLVSAHLITPRRSDRFVLHDLLRLFATELACEEDAEPVREAALQRLYDHYTRTAEASVARLYPNTLRLPLSHEAARVPVVFDDDSAASEWLDTERPNLVAAIRHAAQHGPRLDACRLAASLHSYLFTRLHYVEWLTVARAGAAAARALGHARARAVAHLSLAQLHRTRSQPRAAIKHLNQALALCRRDGWMKGETAALNDISGVYDLDGRVDQTASHLKRALELSRLTNARVDEAIILGNLSRTILRVGMFAEAVAYLERALSLHSRFGSRISEARTIASLGEAVGLSGEHDRARALLSQATAMQRELGDRAFLPTTLYRSARVHLDAGDVTRAGELAADALALARETGHRRSEAGPILALAMVDESSGHYESALKRYDLAFHVTRELGNRYLHVRVLIGLGAVQLRLGRRGKARHHLDKAVAMARRSGYRVLEEQALATMPTIVDSLWTGSGLTALLTPQPSDIPIIPLVERYEGVP